TITTYRRMFYLAVIILLINICVSFTAGMYAGLKFTFGNASGGMDHIPATKILAMIGIGLAILIPLVAAVFFILRWGFNKLYGRYLISLQETMKELDDTSALE
ncbi:MAG TPA: hypothetical protein VI413_10940, partial [Paludibacter sp.]